MIQSDATTSHDVSGFHPVCRRPALLWSRRGSGRQGGARHCTNDLDALGRDCSACPGRWQAGWKLPHSAMTNPHPLAGPGPSRSRSAPAGGIPLSSSTSPTFLSPVAVVPGRWLTVPDPVAGGVTLGCCGRRLPALGWSGAGGGVVGVFRSFRRLRSGIACGGESRGKLRRGAGGRAARAGGRSASASPRAAGVPAGVGGAFPQRRLKAGCRTSRVPGG